jgi:signal recognition particle receptor subunit beta
LIFVIDSTDFDTLEESKQEFHRLILNEELKNATILVYANKQDLNNAKSVADLIQIYGLDKIKTHQWHIQPCSAKTGEGLLAGLQWLSDQLVYKKSTRFPNNPYIGKLI